MNLHEFKRLLTAAPAKALALMLPDGTPIPAHFHITEAGRARRDFVDCGGTRRSEESCVLQAWVAGDTDHRLTTDKLAAILERTREVIPHDDLPLEIEYEGALLSQFPVKAAETSGDSLVIHLGLKHTDCRAKDRCQAPVPAKDEDATCCAPGCCR